MVPDPPVVITGSYSPSTPSSPAAAGGSYSPSTPSSPAAPGASYSPSAPARPRFIGTDGGPGVVIRGALEPDATGFVALTGFNAALGNKPYFTAPAGLEELPEDAPGHQVQYSIDRWTIQYYPTGTTGPSVRFRAAVGNEATPDLATGWEADPGGDIEPTGTPELEYIPPVSAPAAAGSSYSPSTPSAPPAISS